MATQADDEFARDMREELAQALLDHLIETAVKEAEEGKDLEGTTNDITFEVTLMAQ
jgi:hypothetical protein